MNAGFFHPRIAGAHINLSLKSFLFRASEMPLGSRPGESSGDLCRNYRTDLSLATGSGNNNKSGVGISGGSGGRLTKKLGVVAKAVAATVSADRQARAHGDVKNGKSFFRLRHFDITISRL